MPTRAGANCRRKHSITIKLGKYLDLWRSQFREKCTSSRPYWRAGKVDWIAQTVTGPEGHGNQEIQTRKRDLGKHQERSSLKPTLSNTRASHAAYRRWRRKGKPAKSIDIPIETLLAEEWWAFGRNQKDGVGAQSCELSSSGVSGSAARVWCWILKSWRLCRAQRAACRRAGRQAQGSPRRDPKTRTESAESSEVEDEDEKRARWLADQIRPCNEEGEGYTYPLWNRYSITIWAINAWECWQVI